GAKVYAANKLFATLDPTTRRQTLPGGKVVLFSDTVGFIQKLPTTLIAAFRATLEEVTEADLLVHVVDAAHPNARAQIETVDDTLAEIEMPRVPRILALNKIDLLDEPTDQLAAQFAEDGEHDSIVQLSAQKGIGLEQLLAEVERLLTSVMVEIDLMLPYERGDLISLIHEVGVIDEEQHSETGVSIKARVPARLLPRFPGSQSRRSSQEQSSR